MKDGNRRNSTDDKKVCFRDSTVDESKRVAFYHPISEGLPLRDVEEKRSMSQDENDVKTDEVEKRCSSSVDTGNSSARHVFDFHQLDEDDDDNYSVASTYTYNTVDTSATNESVQSIISRLQSETDRRRRRIMRRRCARTGKRPMKPMKPEDPLRGITVEIRE